MGKNASKRGRVQSFTDKITGIFMFSKSGGVKYKMQGYTYIFIYTHYVYVSVSVCEIHNDRKENTVPWGKKV